MLQSSTTHLPDLKDTAMPETNTELLVLPIIFTLKNYKNVSIIYRIKSLADVR
jgi:hypothetical protein